MAFILIAFHLVVALVGQHFNLIKYDDYIQVITFMIACLIYEKLCTRGEQ